MRRAAVIALAGAALAWPAALAAAGLTITKTSTVVADGMGTLSLRALPGALIDYQLLVGNPAGNLLATVGNVTVVDVLPATVKLRVVDLVGGGPIEFVDGNQLGLGLVGSGLAYSYAALGSAADGVDFSSDGGVSWTYVPVPDADGFDPRVRAVRVRLTGVQVASSGFRLRFRVAIR